MIRLLLADDQTLVCQGLKAILDQEADFQVVGIAENGAVAIELTEALHPDIVLMDVRMPVMNGLDAAQVIRQRFPETRVLVLSTFDDDRYIAASIRAGANGYLIKDMPFDELTQSIRLACRGYTQMGPGLMEKLVIKLPQSESDKTDSVQNAEHVNQLTPREHEVLRLLRFGTSNRDIAAKLYITEGTVKTHINHILNRLGLKNRAQLAIYAHSVFSPG